MNEERRLEIAEKAWEDFIRGGGEQDLKTMAVSKAATLAVIGDELEKNRDFENPDKDNKGVLFMVCITQHVGDLLLSI